MLVIKTQCSQCGAPLAVMDVAPEPRSDADYFGQLMMEAVADVSTPVGPDEPCPKCGADLLTAAGAE